MGFGAAACTQYVTERAATQPLRNALNDAIIALYRWRIRAVKVSIHTSGSSTRSGDVPHVIIIGGDIPGCLRAGPRQAPVQTVEG